MTAPIELTDANFQSEVKEFEGVALVDFWAPWCGPCRMMAPIIADLARDNQGVVKVGKLNVDENPSTAAEFGIMSIPTLILFKDGRPVDKIIGVQPKGAIQQRIERLKG